MSIAYRNTLPTKDAFYALYQTTNWNRFNADELHLALQNSWYMVSVFDDEQHRLIGFGRIISDGIYQTFIGDVIVLPEYQGRGIGKGIMTRLIEYCREQSIRWVQLTCAQGKRAFYEKLGFCARPEDAPGMQLSIALS